MKKTLSTVALVWAASLFLSAFAQAQVQPIDRVVAIVNKDVVLQSELDERLQNISSNATASGMRLPPKVVLEQQVLDHLITERLQLQTAKMYGMEIPDQHVNSAIAEMQRKSNLSEQAFWAEIGREGFTQATLREKIRRDMLLQQVQRGIVQQRIRISEQEIDNFLSSSDGAFWRSPEYRLGHILVSLPQAPNSEELAAAEARAEELYQKLQGGAVFAEVAIAESDGNDALSGGDMGWRKSGDLPSLFAEVVPTLQPGQVSEPQRSNAGFHILKLYETRGEQEPEVVTQNRSRHILIKPSEIVSEEQAKAKLEQLRQEILDGADFGELAKTHSEDIGSALQGGDLGWANPGQFVAEFEKLAQTLPEGEVSEPFRSEFGWHILQVQERREEDMTDELIRHKARNMLMSRRFEDELQIWQRELRDDAYIEIKIDTAES